jgi:hypothetical protein
VCGCQKKHRVVLPAFRAAVLVTFVLQLKIAMFIAWMMDALGSYSVYRCVCTHTYICTYIHMNTHNNKLYIFYKHFFLITYSCILNMSYKTPCWCTCICLTSVFLLLSSCLRLLFNFLIVGSIEGVDQVHFVHLCHSVQLLLCTTQVICLHL